VGWLQITGIIDQQGLALIMESTCLPGKMRSSQMEHISQVQDVMDLLVRH
jgi:hypothetical protein